MHNPHTLERDLVYLAAMIDGEGTITLERSGKRRLQGVMGLSPTVVVTNTNEAIIQHVVNIFHGIGVNPYIKTQQATNGGRCKTCYWVTVKGITKVRLVLEAIKPFLVGKLSQANLVLEFAYLRGDSSLAKGKPYGEVELGILQKIRALNFRGVSETEDYALGIKRSQINDSPINK